MYIEKTLEYYSKWLGKDRILYQNFTGITYIYSEERDKIPDGYGQPFDIYIFADKNRWIISYGNKAKEKIEKLKNYTDKIQFIENLKTVIKTVYNGEIHHNIKYIFQEPVKKAGRAIVLNHMDYHKYEEFFRKCNPDCKNTDWLKEYFEEMVQEHICTGIFNKDILVSCTDAPAMPYMSDKVQEIGIHTLPECRGKGYAAEACIKCIEKILENGKIPQWSTDINNIASQKLARKVGFAKLADVITVTL
ncbi:MAG: GNAT family N-acetyltransferase [Lachnospiraceae bacterium]|nr:GNAT family N-acetyltransferase [Lachnospiraceae bacterium]